MKKIIVLFLLTTGVLTLSGCSLYSNPANINLNQSPAPISTDNSDTVDIQNFSFTPQILIIKKGATVTWTNNDSSPHQIKSATFNSNFLSNGQAFSFTFDTIGTFDYSCSIHPSMTGKIIVE